jgi:peptidyl-prolyl cis-trans isomerase SurA
VLLVTALAAATPSVIAATALDFIVAVVNDDVVMASELQRYLERIKVELSQRQTELPPPEVLQKQALERLVLMKIQLQLANQTGIKVDDETLNRAINNIANENKMSLSQFRDAIESQGYPFAQFREDIRQEIIVSKLRQKQVDNLIHVSDREIDNYLETQAQQDAGENEYRLSHILVATPEGASAEQIKSARKKAEALLERLRDGEDFKKLAVAESGGPQALNGGDLGWRKISEIPGLFVDAVKTLREGEVSDVIRNPNGFHIIQLTGSRRAAGTEMIKQTQARHILIKPTELVSTDQARERLRQLKARIEGGEEFSSLARAHSDDKGSAAKGGDLGWVNPGDMLPKFEDAMNATGNNQVSEPFETDYGWHIVQVLERREHDASNELLRTRARDAIRQRRAEEERQAWLRRLRDEAYVEYRTGR